MQQSSQQRNGPVEYSHRHPSRTALAAAVAVALALIVVSFGCQHLLAPPPAPPLADSAQLDGLRPTLRLVNGHHEETARWFRSEGLHHLGADLREWTDQVIQELAIELREHDVQTFIGGEDAPGSFSAAVLEVKVTRLEPPRPLTESSSAGGGAVIEAELRSADGRLERRLNSGDPQAGFVAAVYELKRGILLDAAVQGWLKSPPTP